MNLRIGIDIDGTLTDNVTFQREVMDPWYKRNGYSLKDEYVYNYCKRYGCSQDIVNKFWKENHLTYMSEVGAKPYAAEVIKTLQQLGCHIYIISARTDGYNGVRSTGFDERFVTIDWLNRHKIYYDGVYLVGDKNTGKVKSEKIEELKLDWYIEDCGQIFKELSKVTKVICMENKYNILFEKDATAVAKTWLGILKILEK